MNTVNVPIITKYPMTSLVVYLDVLKHSGPSSLDQISERTHLKKLTIAKILDSYGQSGVAQSTLKTINGESVLCYSIVGDAKYPKSMSEAYPEIFSTDEYDALLDLLTGRQRKKFSELFDKYHTPGVGLDIESTLNILSRTPHDAVKEEKLTKD